MRKTFAILALSAILLLPPAAEAAAPKEAAKARMGIAAIVNDDVITMSDVDNRVHLYLSGSPARPTEEARKAMEQNVLSKLIDEKLQLNEAKSLGITIEEAQIQEAFASIAQQNRFSADEFKQRLAAAGVRVNTLYDQIRSEIAWGQVAKRKLRPQVTISESEIDSEIALGGAVLAEEGAGYIHLKQIAIAIPANAPQEAVAAKMAQAERLKTEATSCAAMDEKMKQFPSPGTSDSPNIPMANLPPPIKELTDPLPIGTLSAPIRVKDGILAIMVCSRSDAPVTPAGTGPENAHPPAQAEMMREQVANKLGFKRLQQMQERYLRDLRATAFIDKRI